MLLVIRVSSISVQSFSYFISLYLHSIQMPMQLTVDANFKPTCPRHTFRHRFRLTVTQSIGKVNKQKWAQNRKGLWKGEGGGKWRKVKMVWNLHKLSAGNWKAKCTNWNNEATVLVCHCSRLPWRTRSLNKMSPTLLQFVAIFASNLQIQSTSSPLPPSLHSVVAASIAAAFWTKDSCKWLVKSQHSNAPRTGRGRPLPLRRHIDKKVQIKEGNGLQKGRNQSRAKQSEAKSLKIKQKSLLALGLDF